MSNAYFLSPHELKVLNSASNYQSDFILEKLEIKNSIKSKLQRSQIDTVKLLAITPLSVIRKTGIKIEDGINIIKSAQEFLKANSENKIESNPLARSGISTGSPKLDNLLNGGIRPGQLVQIHGESGTGKTQLAHQLCVTAQLPYDEGGVDGGVLFLDTDNTFRPERIVSMADALNMDSIKILKNITVARAFSSEHQIYIVKEVSKIIKKKNIRLLVVDSLISHFRNEYHGDSIFLKRQQRLNTHMLDLLNLLKDFNNLAIVVTNQITYDPNLKKNKPAGGRIVFFNSSLQIKLLKGKGTSRIAKIVEAPQLPNHDADFSITRDGIQDCNSHYFIKKGNFYDLVYF